MLMTAAAGFCVAACYGYLVAVNESAKSYLGDIRWLGLVLSPYIGCALIWLPTRDRSRAALLAGMTTSGILLAFALASSAWRISITDQWGGDMQGLFLVIEAGVAFLVVIVASAVSYAVYRRVPGSEPHLTIRH